MGTGKTIHRRDHWRSSSSDVCPAVQRGPLFWGNEVKRGPVRLRVKRKGPRICTRQLEIFVLSRLRSKPFSIVKGLWNSFLIMRTRPWCWKGFPLGTHDGWSVFMSQKGEDLEPRRPRWFWSGHPHWKTRLTASGPGRRHQSLPLYTTVERISLKGWNDSILWPLRGAVRLPRTSGSV